MAKFACSHCDRKFDTPRALMAHSSYHDPNRKQRGTRRIPVISLEGETPSPTPQTTKMTPRILVVMNSTSVKSVHLLKEDEVIDVPFWTISVH